jgi:hypothetical protein
MVLERPQMQPVPFDGTCMNSFESLISRHWRGDIKSRGDFIL